MTEGQIMDVLRDGLSMVYSFYRPELADRSVGSFMVLDHVRLALELGLPYEPTLRSASSGR